MTANIMFDSDLVSTWDIGDSIVTTEKLNNTFDEIIRIIDNGN